MTFSTDSSLKHLSRLVGVEEGEFVGGFNYCAAFECRVADTQGGGREMTTLAYHGTDRMDFSRFDIAEARPYNIGLHFGMKAAAESRIAYLREENPSAKCRILTCELTLENPLRIEDVFGHTYGWLFEALEREIGRARTPAAPLRRKYEMLSRRWMNADDNPRFAKNPSLYFAFNQKLNAELRRLFPKLGYDGFIYTNELEDDESTADSYCVFDAQKISILGEDMVQCGGDRVKCSA